LIYRNAAALKAQHVKNNPLEMAERHVLEGERQMVQQQRLLAWLEQANRGKSESGQGSKGRLGDVRKDSTAICR